MRITQVRGLKIGWVRRDTVEVKSKIINWVVHVNSGATKEIRKYEQRNTFREINVEFSCGHCISSLELPQEITKSLVAQSNIKLFFQSLGVQKTQIQVLAG